MKSKASKNMKTLCKEIVFLIAFLVLSFSLVGTAFAQEGELPDLVVNALEAPASASTQQQIEVSWIVSNQGDGDAVPVWYDHVYLSTDDQLDDSDTHLGSHWHSELLPAGENYTATPDVLPMVLAGTYGVWIPPVPPGTYHLLVKTDYLDSVYESNEDNNVFARQIAIDVPDLVVTAIEAPASASTQQQIEVSWTIENPGDGIAEGYWGYWYDSLYLSANDQWDTDDTWLTYSYTNRTVLPGDNYTATLTASIPIVPAGTYYLLVKTDDSNYLYESNEDNNVFARQIAIDVPDLVVTAIEAPASASTQQQIEVSWTVQNQGDGNATASWYDRIYISADEQLDSSDTPILLYAYGQPLVSNESYTITETMITPDVPSGTYFLLVRADASQVLYESNEENNILAEEITIQVPDLVVTNINAPASASTGQHIDISWTVENQGVGEAVGWQWYQDWGWQWGSYWTDFFYLSTDDKLDDADVSINGESHYEPLSANESYTATRTGAVPNVPSGTYYLLVQTDVGYYGNHLYESNEGNNVLAQPITIQVPDLVVTAIDSPAYASTQQQIQVSWTIQNQGDGTATANLCWSDGLYWSTDTQLDPSDSGICGRYGCQHCVSLAAGESYDAMAGFMIPCVPAGKYYLLAVSDRGIYGNGNIYESDEGNNILAKPIIIQVPDLVVTSIDAPAFANPQQQIQVSWTITNQGDGKSAVMWGRGQGWLFGGDWLYLSTDGQLDASDTVIARHWHSEAPASHESFTATETVTIPAVAPGNYYLLVQADYYNYLYESREWNNVLPKLITIVEEGEEGGFTETYSDETTLVEELLSQKATLSDGTVTGDLTGTFNFTGSEIVSVNSGAFTGKGFFTGQWEATLDGISYRGDWQGASFLVASEGKIYLKGSISGGEASGIVEGYLTESLPESGVYDKYHAVWKVGRLGDKTVSAALNLDGSVSYGESFIYPSTEIYALQTAVNGTTFGHYTESLSSILTHLRVVDEDNPYHGQGFSIISYTSNSGQGEGWTYDKEVSPGIVEMKGLFSKPLLGIASGMLDETKTPRTLSVTIERVDLGLPPMADLEVKVWGPERVSPGQTVNYIIEYRNDGVKVAENTVLFFGLDLLMNYVSSSHSFYNDENGVIRMDLGTVNSKDGGLIRVTGNVSWGLNQGTSLGNSAKIYTASVEGDLSEGPEVTQWRNDLQPGDILLAKHKDSIVPGYWDHAGGVVYGTYTDHWTGKTYEGWFVIEAVPCGVIVNDIKNWDYPRADGKEDVVVLGVDSLTPEQKNYVVNFWNQQITKPYQNPAWSKMSDMPMLDSNIDAPSWYCSELIWGPYHNLGIEFNTLEYGALRIAPSEIYESEYVTTISFYHKGMFGEDINTDKWISTVTIARDPNIKYGPEGNVLPGQRLNYKVEYENEGEGIAFGVYFTDTLDEDLDDSTLEIGPVISTIDGSEIALAGTYNPSTRTITWLVGEVGPGEGGYADISVNVTSDAPDGTEIINFGTVYFPSVPETTRTNGIVSIVGLNQPPIADAGPDQSVCVVPPSTIAMVTLDGSGSYDPDGDPLTYNWTWDDNTAHGVNATVELPLGTTTITLVVNDGKVDSEPDMIDVTVETTPPVPTMVPTMDKWGIVAMITLFAALLVWTVRRRGPVRS